MIPTVLPQDLAHHIWNEYLLFIYHIRMSISKYHYLDHISNLSTGVDWINLNLFNNKTDSVYLQSTIY